MMIRPRQRRNIEHC